MGMAAGREQFLQGGEQNSIIKTPLVIKEKHKMTHPFH